MGVFSSCIMVRKKSCREFMSDSILRKASSKALETWAISSCFSLLKETDKSPFATYCIFLCSVFKGVKLLINQKYKPNRKSKESK